MSLGTGALKVGREPERLRYSREVSMATKTLPAAEKICRSQSVRSTRDRGRTSCNMKMTWSASPNGEISHHSLHRTERIAAQTNIQVGPLMKRVSLGRLDGYTHTRRLRGSIHYNILHSQVHWRRENDQIRHC